MQNQQISKALPFSNLKGSGYTCEERRERACILVPSSILTDLQWNQGICEALSQDLVPASKDITQVDDKEIAWWDFLKLTSLWTLLLSFVEISIGFQW